MSGKTLEFRAMRVHYRHPRRGGAEARTGPMSFWNQDYWDHYLRLWSEEGFNAVVWLGPNETGASAQGSDHLLLRHEEFPEARELSSEENEEIIMQMKWLLRRAKDLGMRNFLYTHLVWVTPAFARAHDIDEPMPVSPTVSRFHNEQYGPAVYPNCGVVNEWTRAYTEAIYAEFPRLYEDLDGFWAPIGESLPGDRAAFYREAVVPGLKRSGRRPLMIAHNWQVPQEDYLKNVAPKEVYDSTWLGFHAYNTETITDSKPYPELVDWSERVGLPCVVQVVPTNVLQFPFNSPRLAYEITYEMKKVENLVGYVYFECTGRKLSPLFRKALAHYARSPEPYSDEPWLALLQAQFGDRRSAQHFLEAYDISGRIIPETCALIYCPHNPIRRELRLPYRFFTGEMQWSWMTSRVRGKHIIPVAQYARSVARDPARYKDNNGSDPNRHPYEQSMIWGGGDFEETPVAHMRKVRAMGEACLREAEEGLTHVKTNREEAERVRDWMKAYKLLSYYYERKSVAGTTALIYSQSLRAEDRDEAEALADEALDSYLVAASFMHEKLDPVMVELHGRPMHEAGVEIPELIELEKKERQDLASIFRWPEGAEGR